MRYPKEWPGVDVSCLTAELLRVYSDGTCAVRVVDPRVFGVNYMMLGNCSLDTVTPLTPFAAALLAALGES